MWKAICENCEQLDNCTGGLKDTHEDTGTALSRRALATETLDLAVGLHLVVLKDGHLDLLALVLDLLGGL